MTVQQMGARMMFRTFHDEFSGSWSRKLVRPTVRDMPWLYIPRLPGGFGGGKWDGGLRQTFLGREPTKRTPESSLMAGDASRIAKREVEEERRRRRGCEQVEEEDKGGRFVVTGRARE